VLDVGSIIRNIRKGLGKNQRDFSQFIGIKQGTLSQYESGVARPGTTVLIRILNLAPMGSLKDELNQHLVSRLKEDHPEYPELAQGVAEMLCSSDAVYARLPRAENREQAEQLKRFADLVASVGTLPRLDKSVVDILDYLLTCYVDANTLKVFQDTKEYLSVRYTLLAGFLEDDADNWRRTVKSARRMAMALLRQAEAAEEKADRCVPEKKVRKRLNSSIRD
jgi:DNA-binding XRE family transcriptional regulator